MISGAPLHRSRQGTVDGGGTTVAAATGRLLCSVFTDRSDGDLAIDLPDAVLHARRRAVAPTPWTWLRQVHGADVVVVRHPGEQAGAVADAAVTTATGATLAVNTADCAGVVLRGSGPDVDAIGVAHAGWRGLAAGVLEATSAALQELGADRLEFQLGPCISAPMYEFGEVPLRELVERFGVCIRAETADGRPALDLRAAVRRVLSRLDVLELAPGADVACTASSPAYWSHRADGTRSRQATVAWIEPA